MRATDVLVSQPTVSPDQSVAEAGRTIAATGRIGVVVARRDGSPVGLITAVDVLKLALPDYLVRDPSLAATLDEAAVEEMSARLQAKTVGEFIADRAVTVRAVPEVDPDATLLEIAAVLVSAGSTIAAVTGVGGERRFVTLPVVLDALWHRQAPAADGSDERHGTR